MLRLDRRTLMCSVTDVTNAMRLEQQHVAA